MFASLGRWCFRNRRVVLLAWIVVLVGAIGGSSAIGNAFDGAFEIPASESADGFETLTEFFPDQDSSYGGTVVFKTDAGAEDPTIKESMEEAFAEIDAIEGVAVVSPYGPEGVGAISQDGTIGIARINLDVDIDQTAAGEIGKRVREALPVIDGLQTEVGGQVLAEFEPPESELVGLAFAIVVLILSFGSVLAMGLPISVAVFGVVTGAGSIGLMTHVVKIPDFAPSIGAMIGLGVGIDYALFIVTRYREGTRAGLSHEDATVVAMDTAGRAVSFAGVTVVVSLLGMLLMGLAFVSGMGIAAATTVAITMVASLTLLPALLGFAQHRVEVTRWRGLLAAGGAAVALLGAGLGIPVLFFVGVGFAALTMLAGFFVEPLKREVPPRVERPVRETTAYKWSRAIQHRPWVALAVGGGILVLLAAPVFSLHLGFSDEGNYAEESTTRKAYDLVAEGFGPGTNGPFILAIEVGESGPAAVGQLVEAVQADPGVVLAQAIPSDFANPEASPAYLVQIIPTTSPQDSVTQETVERLRSQVIAPIARETGVTANLTGAVPANIDFTSYLSGRLPIFLGVVLALSFILLMAVFRSLLVPLKAVVMNMLSIASAYGVVVAIFQWGWFNGFTGVEPAPIEPFIPMMLFAIVFGLSMDYEVFLLSRVKEEYERHGDARNSVADGLAATARVISAAAAIMVVVFGSFLFEDDRIIKLFGTGLAAAVLLDATLVRMLLVPATMELLGERNWWLPAWIDKILPELNVEGSGHHDLLIGEAARDKEPVS